MRVLTVTQARDNIFNLFEQIHENHEPLFIKGKKHNAILISEEDWRSIQETLYLSSIPGMVESIKEGLNAKDEEFVEYVFGD